jgi:hypothetical protein
MSFKLPFIAAMALALAAEQLGSRLVDSAVLLHRSYAPKPLVGGLLLGPTMPGGCWGNS